MVTIAERGRCFAFVTRPDEGPYVRWTYRLEPSGTGTRVTEIWDVEQLSPGRRTHTQAQHDERSRYTEGMLATTLAGFVANFAQEVVKEQLPLSAGDLGGERVEQFGRSEALVSLLNHQLSFPDHVHEFDTDESGLRRVKRFEA